MTLMVYHVCWSQQAAHIDALFAVCAHEQGFMLHTIKIEMCEGGMPPSEKQRSTACAHRGKDKQMQGYRH
jgi:hypothetical protein